MIDMDQNAGAGVAFPGKTPNRAGLLTEARVGSLHNRKENLMKSDDMIAVGPACTVELDGNKLVYVAAPDAVNTFREVVPLPPGVGAGSVAGLAVSVGLLTVRTKDRLHVWNFNVRKWTVAASLVAEEARR